MNLALGTIGHTLITLLLLFLLLAVWIRSFGPDISSKAGAEERALRLLAGLRTNLNDHNAAERMQDVFPEGACFTWTLYGLAWANLLRNNPDWSDEQKRLALNAITASLKGQQTKESLSPFGDTQVHNGVFWLGQRNLLLGCLLQLQHADSRTTTELEEFHHNSQQLHTAFMDRETHHLDSYDGMCWPTDSIAALTSLTIHDELFGTSYRSAFQAWKDWTIAHAWNGSQLPAGRLNGTTGQHIEPARGVANSWIVPLIFEMDSSWGAELYNQHRKHFGIRRLGFRMFREWPAEHKGSADIDSGPIIWGAGAAATGIGLAAARAAGDRATAQDVFDLSRMFGFPTQADGPGSEWYYFGQVPVGDAFLAYGLSIPLAPDPVMAAGPSSMRWLFHVSAGSVLLLFLTQYILLTRRGFRLAREAIAATPALQPPV